jgi:PAS domain S-box-containing protein
MLFPGPLFDWLFFAASNRPQVWIFISSCKAPVQTSSRSTSGLRFCVQWLPKRGRVPISKRDCIGPVRSRLPTYVGPWSSAVGLLLTMAAMIYLALSRRHTARLDAMRNQLARIIESAQDGIIGKDLNGVITSWNKGAEKIYGYTAAEIVGRNIDVLAPPERKHEIAELFAKVRCGEEVKHYSTERITKAGQRIDVSVSFSPIMDSSGTLTGVSTIARDHFSIFISAGQRSVRLLTERDAGAEPTAVTRASPPNMRWPNCSRHRCRRATPAEFDQA